MKNTPLYTKSPKSRADIKRKKKFSPIIASSLVLALGVSVSMGQNFTGQSGDINTAGNHEIQSGSYNGNIFLPTNSTSPMTVEIGTTSKVVYTGTIGGKTNGATNTANLTVNFQNGSTMNGNIQTGKGVGDGESGNDFSGNYVFFGGNQTSGVVLTGNIISYGTGVNNDTPDTNNGNHVTFTSGSMQGNIEVYSTQGGSSRTGYNQVSFSANSDQTLNGNITSQGGVNLIAFSGTGDKSITGSISASNSTRSGRNEINSESATSLTIGTNLTGSISANNSGYNDIRSNGLTINVNTLYAQNSGYNKIDATTLELAVNDITAKDQGYNYIEADNLILNMNSIIAGVGGHESKNFIEAGATTLRKSISIRANNGQNNNTEKVNILKFNGDLTVENSAVISDITAYAWNGDNNKYRTKNILSFNGLSSETTLTIAYINKQNVISSQAAGNNYIGGNLTSGDAMSRNLSLVNGFSDSTWSSDTYRANNLNLIIGNDIYGYRSGVNYINVKSIEVRGEIDGNGGTNKISTSGDFTANTIKGRWSGSNVVMIGGNATFNGSIYAEGSSGGAGGTGSNTFTFSNASATITMASSQKISVGGNGSNTFNFQGNQTTINSDLTLERTAGSGKNKFNISASKNLSLASNKIFNTTSGQTEILFQGNSGSFGTSGSGKVKTDGGTTTFAFSQDGGTYTLSGELSANNGGQNIIDLSSKSATINSNLSLSGSPTGSGGNIIKIGNAKSLSFSDGTINKTLSTTSGVSNVNFQGASGTFNGDLNTSGGTMTFNFQDNGAYTVSGNFGASNSGKNIFNLSDKSVTISNDLTFSGTTPNADAGNIINIGGNRTLTIQASGSGTLTTNSGLSTVNFNGASGSFSGKVSTTGGVTLFSFNQDGSFGVASEFATSNDGKNIINVTSKSVTLNNGLVFKGSSVSNESGNIIDIGSGKTLTLASSGNVNTQSGKTHINFASGTGTLVGGVSTSNANADTLTTITLQSGASGVINGDIAGDGNNDILYKTNTSGTNSLTLNGTNNNIRNLKVEDTGNGILAGNTATIGTINLSGSHTANLTLKNSRSAITNLTNSGTGIFSLDGTSNAVTASVANAISASGLTLDFNGRGTGHEAQLTLSGSGNTLKTLTVGAGSTNNTLFLTSGKTTFGELVNISNTGTDITFDLANNVEVAFTGNMQTIGATSTFVVDATSATKSAVISGGDVCASELKLTGGASTSASATLKNSTITLLTLTTTGAATNTLTLDTSSNAVSTTLNNAISGANLKVALGGTTTNSATFILGNSGGVSTTLKALTLQNNSSANKNIFQLNSGNTTITDGIDIEGSKGLNTKFYGNGTTLVNNVTNNGDFDLDFNAINATLKGGIDTQLSGNTAIALGNSANAVVTGSINTADTAQTNVTFSSTAQTLTIQGETNTITSITASGSTNILKLDTNKGNNVAGNVTASVKNAILGGNLNIQLSGKTGGIATLTLNNTDGDSAIKSLALTEASSDITSNVLNLVSNKTTINDGVSVGANQGLTINLESDGVNLESNITSSGNTLINFKNGINTISGSIIADDGTTTLDIAKNTDAVVAGLIDGANNAIINFQANDGNDDNSLNLAFSDNMIKQVNVADNGNAVIKGDSATIKETILGGGAKSKLTIQNSQVNITTFTVNNNDDISTDATKASNLTLDASTQNVGVAITKGVGGEKLDVVLGGGSNKAELTLKNSTITTSVLNSLTLSSNSSVNQNVLNLNAGTTTVTKGVTIGGNQGLTINFKNSSATLVNDVNNSGNVLLDFRGTDGIIKGVVKSLASANTDIKVTNTGTIVGGIETENFLTATSATTNISFASGANTLKLQGQDNAITSIAATGDSNILKLDTKNNAVNAGVKNGITGDKLNISFGGVSGKNATLTLNNTNAGSSIKSISVVGDSSKENNLLNLMASTTTVSNGVSVGASQGLTINLKENNVNLASSLVSSGDLLVNFEKGTNTITGTITASAGETKLAIADGVSGVVSGKVSDANKSSGASGIIVDFSANQNSSSNSLSFNSSGNTISQAKVTDGGNAIIKGSDVTIGTVTLGNNNNKAQLTLQNTTSNITTLAVNNSTTTASTFALETTTQSVNANVSKAINGANLDVVMGGQAGKVATLTLNNVGGNTELKSLSLSQNSGVGDNILNLNANATKFLSGVSVADAQGLTINFAEGADTVLDNSISVSGVSEINFKGTQGTITGTVTSDGTNAQTTINVSGATQGVIDGAVTYNNGGINILNFLVGTNNSLTLNAEGNKLTQLNVANSGSSILAGKDVAVATMNLGESDSANLTLKNTQTDITALNANGATSTLTLDATSNGVQASVTNAVAGNNLTVNFMGKKSANTSSNTSNLTLKAGGNHLKAITVANGSKGNTLALESGTTSINDKVNVASNSAIDLNLGNTQNSAQLTLTNHMQNAGEANVNFKKDAGSFSGDVATSGTTTFTFTEDSGTYGIVGNLSTSGSGKNIIDLSSKSATISNDLAFFGNNVSNGAGNIINIGASKTLTLQNGSDIKSMNTTSGNTYVNFNGTDGTLNGNVSTTGGSTTLSIADATSGTTTGNIETSGNGVNNVVFANTTGAKTLTFKGVSNAITTVTSGGDNSTLALDTTNNTVSATIANAVSGNTLNVDLGGGTNTATLTLNNANGSTTIKSLNLTATSSTAEQNILNLKANTTTVSDGISVDANKGLTINLDGTTAGLANAITNAGSAKINFKQGVGTITGAVSTGGATTINVGKSSGSDTASGIIAGVIDGTGNNEVVYGASTGSKSLSLKGAGTNQLTLVDATNAGALILGATSGESNTTISKAIKGSNLSVTLNGANSKTTKLTLNNADNSETNGTHSTISTLTLGANSAGSGTAYNTLELTSGNTTIGSALSVDGGKGINFDFNGTTTQLGFGANGDQALTNSAGIVTLNFKQGSGTFSGAVTTSGGTTTINVSNGATGTITRSVDTSSGTTNVAFAGGSNAKKLTLNGAGNTISAITLGTNSANNTLELTNGTTAVNNKVSINDNQDLTLSLEDSNLAFRNSIENKSSNNPSSLIFNLEGTNTISGDISTSIAIDSASASTDFNIDGSTTIDGNILTEGQINAVVAAVEFKGASANSLILKGATNKLTSLVAKVDATKNTLTLDGTHVGGVNNAINADIASLSNGSALDVVFATALDNTLTLNDSNTQLKSIGFNGGANKGTVKLSNTVSSFNVGTAGSELSVDSGATLNITALDNSSLTLKNAINATNATSLLTVGKTSGANVIAEKELTQVGVSFAGTTSSLKLQGNTNTLTEATANNAGTLILDGTNSTSGVTTTITTLTGNKLTAQFNGDTSKAATLNLNGGTLADITIANGAIDENFLNLETGTTIVSDTNGISIESNKGLTINLEGSANLTSGISNANNTDINFTGTNTLNGAISTTDGTTNINVGSAQAGATGVIDGTVDGAGVTNINFANGSNAKKLTLNGADNTIYAIVMGTGNSSTNNTLELKNGTTTISNAGGVSVDANQELAIDFNGASATRLSLNSNTTALSNAGTATLNFKQGRGTFDGAITATSGTTTINVGDSGKGANGIISGAVTASGTSFVANIGAGSTLTLTTGLTTSAGDTEINFKNGVATLNGEISTINGTTTINVSDNTVGIIGGNVTTGTTFRSARSGGAGSTETNIVFANGGTLILQGTTNTITNLTMGQGTNILSLTERDGNPRTQDARRKVTINNLDNTNSGTLKLVSQVTETEADIFVIESATLPPQSKDANQDSSQDTTQPSEPVKTNYNFGLTLAKDVDIKRVGENGAVRVASVANDSGIVFSDKSDMVVGFTTAEADFVKTQTDVNGVIDRNGTYTTYSIGKIQARDVVGAEKEVTATAFALNYDLYMANLNSLNKRMGDLRENDHSQGVWARVFNGAQSNKQGLGSKSNYTTVQAGYDYAFGFEGANNYLGFALSYALSTSTSEKAFDAQGEKRGISGIYSSAIEAAIYNSYVSDYGWYNDTIAKFSYITSDFSIDNINSGTSISNTTKNYAFTLDNEVGYQFGLGENKEWGITPQVELTFGYFNQSDFKQTIAGSTSYLDAMADAVLTLRARAGSSFSYDFKNFTSSKVFNASLYVGAFYEYDYVHGGDISMTTDLGVHSNELGDIGSDGRVVINVGTNMNIQDSTRLYFDFEKSFLGDLTIDYQVNFGVRYSFGESDGYTPISLGIEEQESKKAPLKIDDKSESQKDKETKSGEKEGEKTKDTKESKSNEDKKDTKPQTQTTKKEDKKEISSKSLDKKAADKKAADKKAADKKTTDKKTADKKVADKKIAKK